MNVPSMRSHKRSNLDSKFTMLSSSLPTSFPKFCNRSTASPISVASNNLFFASTPPNNAQLAANNGARCPLSITRSQTRNVHRVGNTFTNNVNNHCELVIALTMLSAPNASKCTPNSGSILFTTLENTRWSSIAFAIPSVKYPGTILFTKPSKHQNALSSSIPESKKNAQIKFMDCTYPVAGSCWANANSTCFNEFHILSPGLLSPHFSNVCPLLGKSFSICDNVSKVVFVGSIRARSSNFWKCSSFLIVFVVTTSVSSNFDAHRLALVSSGYREECRHFSSVFRSSVSSACSFSSSRGEDASSSSSSPSSPSMFLMFSLWEKKARVRRKQKF